MVLKFYFEKGGYFGHYTVPNPALSQNHMDSDRHRHRYYSPGKLA